MQAMFGTETFDDEAAVCVALKCPGVLSNLRKHRDGSGSREQWNAGSGATAVATNQRYTLKVQQFSESEIEHDCLQLMSSAPSAIAITSIF
jgi:hypothetical protein